MRSLGDLTAAEYLLDRAGDGVQAGAQAGGAAHGDLPMALGVIRAGGGRGVHRLQWSIGLSCYRPEDLDPSDGLPCAGTRKALATDNFRQPFLSAPLACAGAAIPAATVRSLGKRVRASQ